VELGRQKSVKQHFNPTNIGTHKAKKEYLCGGCGMWASHATKAILLFFIACIAKSAVIRRQIVSWEDGANPHEMGIFSNPANKAA